MSSFKTDFPIFKTHPTLVYLDSAATSQKPQQVIDSVGETYKEANANVHRGLYSLSETVTDRFEAARSAVAAFIGASSPSQVVFTSGATASINLAAFGWAKKHLSRGDVIVLSEMEHHANVVPWLRLRDEVGVELHFLGMDDTYRLKFEDASLEMSRVKLVALTHASNVLGTVNPVSEIASFFKSKNKDIKVLVDAAQSVPHLPINVEELDIDFMAFSAHKMLGPAGVGVLWARTELLEEMDPLVFGGSMIELVTKDTATWAAIPAKFEAGTPNIEGVIGMAAAIEYLNAVGLDKIAAHERDLTQYALEQLKGVNGLLLHGPTTAEDRLGVFSFSIEGVHPHDVSEILNRDQIAVRTGHHCAQLLMSCLGVAATARASFYLYNTREDVDRLVASLEKVTQALKVQP